MSSLADYLAKNYLSADRNPAKKSKKRKRKDAEANSSGLIIADDDVSGWGNKKEKDNDEDDNIMVTAGRSADFRKKENSAWTTVGAPAPSESDQAAADAIILSATAESRARATEVDDAPVVEGEVIDDALTPGLHVPAKKHHRKEKRRSEEDELANLGPAPETIYRDASGRIINVAMKRQEARKKAEEEERKKREEADQARGDVQLHMREERKRELEEAKYLTVARSADDYEMNDELKEVQRWNDPAAGFLSAPKKTAGGVRSRGSGKPVYQGAFEPNRYGIKPGYRWDGVDRANGFEKKWFAARNKKKDVAALEYAWQMDE